MAISDGIGRHTPTLSNKKRVRFAAFDESLLPDLSDAIAQLTFEWQWVQLGGDSVDSVVSAAIDALDSWYSDMLIGCVLPFLADLPAGFLKLDGSTYDKDDYPELYDVLPDAIKTATQFTLPDLVDAFPYHVDLASSAGVVAGSNDLTLTVAQLPEHTHTYTPPVASIDVETPTTPIPGVTVGAPTATGSTGSGDTIDRRPLRAGFVFGVFSGRI